MDGGQDRPRAGHCGHRWLVQRGRCLGCGAAGGGNGARQPAAGRCREVAAAAGRAQAAGRQGDPSGRKISALRRAGRGRCRDTAVWRAAQRPQGLDLDRPECATCRYSGQGRWHGAVRPGLAPARHGVRCGAPLPDAGRHAQRPGRGRCEGDGGCRAPGTAGLLWRLHRGLCGGGEQLVAGAAGGTGGPAVMAARPQRQARQRPHRQRA